MNKKINLALIKAAEHGDNAQVYSLLKQGTDVNFEDQYSSTAIMRSAYNGHENTSLMLLEAGFHDPLYLNIAILNAAKQGHEKIVESLITHGADLDNHDFFTGMTPLMYAVQGRHIDVVKVLLAHDADIHLQDKQGHRAFDYINGNMVIEAMLQSIQDNELLMYHVDEMFVDERLIGGIR